MASKGRRPPNVFPADIAVRANPKEIKILGLVSPDIDKHSNACKLTPYVALRYFKSDFQCFSAWTTDELRAFSGFVKSLQQHTWEQVYSTGSRIPKHGLGYTKYNLTDVKSHAIRSALESVMNEVSDDIAFFELRVNQNKLRVHGFQMQSTFFLVVLDREHEAFPM